MKQIWCQEKITLLPYWFQINVANQVIECWTHLPSFCWLLPWRESEVTLDAVLVSDAKDSSAAAPSSSSSSLWSLSASSSSGSSSWSSSKIQLLYYQVVLSLLSFICLLWIFQILHFTLLLWLQNTYCLSTNGIALYTFDSACPEVLCTTLIVHALR